MIPYIVPVSIPASRHKLDRPRHPNSNPGPFCMEWKQVSVLLVVVWYGSLPVVGLSHLADLDTTVNGPNLMDLLCTHIVELSDIIILSYLGGGGVLDSRLNKLSLPIFGGDVVARSFRIWVDEAIPDWEGPGPCICTPNKCFTFFKIYE